MAEEKSTEIVVVSTPLPIKIIDRIANEFYISGRKIVYWDGKILKCKHEKRKERCIQCGGGSICEHNRQRNTCKECKGASICEHNRIRSSCKECKGGSICEHNRVRSSCKECGGSQICEHNRERSRCKECKGSQICEHNRERSRCKECKGSQICEHNRIRSSCKECKGGSICEHNKIRSCCKECEGVSICEHKIRKVFCKECGGSQICEHNKLKHNCYLCSNNTNKFCVTCKVTIVHKNTYHYPHCSKCYSRLNPDSPHSRNYKVKENYFVNYIIDHTEEKWVLDKVIDGGCSGKKPDLFLDLLTHSLIFENDENEHKGYSCENKRMMELFRDLGSRPIIIIRLNSDKYTKNEEKIPSPFKYVDGICIPENTEELLNRASTTVRRLNYWINNIPEKEVTIEYLFYSE